MSTNPDQIWAKNPKRYGYFPDQTKFLGKKGVFGTRTNRGFFWGAMCDPDHRSLPSGT